MRIAISTLLVRAWIVIIAMFVFPSLALAGWGDDNWGTLVWGAAVSGPGVPGLGLLGLMVLAMGLAATAAWTLRKRWPAVGLTLMLVWVAIPLVVVAGEVTLPNTFTNGEEADADQVNDNFGAVKAAVDDNDSRINTAQSTADAAQIRVSGNCAVGSSIREIAANGTVTCEADDNTQLTSAQVAAAATAEGFVAGAHTVNTNTQLDEAAVDAFVANNGFAAATLQGPHDRSGSDNTAVGVDALSSNGTGFSNAAIGARSLQNNTDGTSNTANGSDALRNNSTGFSNTGTGRNVLFSNTTGLRNTANGARALHSNTTGIRNTASGYAALENSTGNDNIALGSRAGINLTTGDNNIAIGNGGVAGESATIRIGTSGTHTTTHLTGDVQIDGSSIGLAEDVLANTAAIAAFDTVPATRFEVCADGVTVADTATGLHWERKTTTAGVHNVNNTYSWSIVGTTADGTAYTDFLATLNAGSFAGHADWRLPIISELQSILVGPGVTSSAPAPDDSKAGTFVHHEYNATCFSSLCIDGRFAAAGGPTASSFYWSASSNATNPFTAWFAFFGNGNVSFINKTNGNFVRAVRAGSCVN